MNCRTVWIVRWRVVRHARISSTFLSSAQIRVSKRFGGANQNFRWAKCNKIEPLFLLLRRCKFSLEGGMTLLGGYCPSSAPPPSLYRPDRICLLGKNELVPNLSKFQMNWLVIYNLVQLTLFNFLIDSLLTQFKLICSRVRKQNLSTTI